MNEKESKYYNKINYYANIKYIVGDMIADYKRKNLTGVEYLKKEIWLNNENFKKWKEREIFEKIEKSELSIVIQNPFFPT